MLRRSWSILTVAVLLSIFLLLFVFVPFSRQVVRIVEHAAPAVTPSPEPHVVLPPPPSSVTLPQRTHVFQTFNNCGPASMSMALSYLDMTVSQQELGSRLRPYQNRQGDNDDKSVTLTELATEAERRGLIAYVRPNGSPEIMKHFIAQGLPVVIRTWLTEGEDIGHYRLIRGYDDQTQEYIQDDSLQGADLRYSYDELDRLWSAFQYEFLVIAPPEKRSLVEAILGELVSEQTAWRQAKARTQVVLERDLQNLTGQFNMSVTSYHLGEYEASVRSFEAVESRLPHRMLWYQIEPIQAYLALGQYDRVMEITEKILQGGNRAFSELYVLRAQVYDAQNQPEKALAERELARQYHSYLVF